MVERMIARSRDSEKNAKYEKLLALKRRMDEWSVNSCDLVISTSGMSPAEVAVELLNHL